MNEEQKCNGLFLEEVEAKWEIQHAIDAYTFPRLLALAKQAGCFQNRIERLRVRNQNLNLRVKELEQVKTEAQKLINIFGEIAQKQDDLLGHGFQAACENWDEASDVGGMIDLTGLKEALKGKI